MLLVGVGLNNSGDLDKASSYWELAFWEEVGLLVGLSGGGGSWSWRMSRVGTRS